MANTRAIVKRRKAIRNIRKITRTMELIATARFKKAMDRAIEASAFTQKISELVAELSQSASATEHPLLQPRENVKNTVLLVLTSNRGLCGGYNSNVLREANNYLNGDSASENVSLQISGKRGIAFYNFHGKELNKSYTHFEDKPTYDEVETLANEFLANFQERKIDELKVVYTRFISAGKQQATITTLLPMGSVEESIDEHTPGMKKRKADEEAQEPHEKSTQLDYEFVPSAEEILNEIVPLSFKVRLFKCFLDAAVSEQIARMTAMKAATDNAGDLIKSLSTQYNRARQSQITSELSEIIGTAEALG